MWLLVQGRCCSVIGRVAARLCSDELPALLKPVDPAEVSQAPVALVAESMSDTVNTCVAALGDHLAAMQQPGDTISSADAAGLAEAAAAADMPGLQKLHAALLGKLQQRLQQVPGSSLANSSISSWLQCGGTANGLQQAARTALGAELALQLQQLGDAVVTQVPSELWCNNPGCSNSAGVSELDLVAGTCSRCSSCKTSR
jgi:hypothetical protein